MNTASSISLMMKSDSTNTLLHSIPLTGNHYLFTVLNWGLGHASRSIPVIQYLLDNNKTVDIASDGLALDLLKSEFPDLSFHTLPSYNIRYGPSLKSIIIKNSVGIAKAIFNEHLKVNKIIENQSIDCIVSDSRFGCFTKAIPCYIISHQLEIPANNSFLKYFINIPNHFFLNRFDACWIPDEKNHLLSGVLSQSSAVRSTRFIGCLSRFDSKKTKEDIDVLILLSGPEPSRSILEEKLFKLYSNSNKKIVFVRGTNQPSQINYPHSILHHDLLTHNDLSILLNRSKVVVSRAGYSSIMDFYKLQKKAIIIPTPGQTEQEYLGNYLNGQFNFICVNEKNIQKVLYLTDAV